MVLPLSTPRQRRVNIEAASEAKFTSGEEIYCWFAISFWSFGVELRLNESGQFQTTDIIPSLSKQIAQLRKRFIDHFGIA